MIWQNLLILVLSILVAIEGTDQTEDTYVNCIKVPEGPESCPRDIHGTNYRTIGKYRTLDGTCNHLKKTNLGSVNTILRRIIPAQYDDKIDLPRGHIQASDYDSLPTAREVSKVVFKPVSDQVKNDKKMSVLFMTFGQFLDHDLSIAPHEECNVTNCASDDKFKYPCMPIKFKKDNNACFGFARSKPACKPDAKKPKDKKKIELTPRDQVNELTAFIDLSQVYGTTKELNKKLRKLDGSGELKVDERNLLPEDVEATSSCRNPGKCHLVGDKRGEENIALLAMHTLWVRQHNRLAEGLRDLNPHWGGEKVYQTARKINGAIWQHIVYNEFLPKLYDIRGFSKVYRGRKFFRRTRYNRRVDPRITNVFSAAAFRFGHSLVPEHFSQMSADFNAYGPPIKLQNAFNNSTAIYKDGIEPTMNGLCGNMSNTIDENIAESLNTKLFIFPGSKLFNDLMSLNIQRGRDHGIPPYMEWRRECGFARFDRKGFGIDDLKYTPRKIREHFKTVYKSVKDIDLFVGGITEHHLRDKIVGPTFSCIFRKQFEALRFGDRFFYTHRGSFTMKQLKAITKISMAKVLCNNLYGLVSAQKDSFKVFDPKNDRRASCESIKDIDLKPWKETP